MSSSHVFFFKLVLHFIFVHCRVHICCRVRQLKILNQCLKRQNRGKESPYSDVPDEGYDQLKEPPGYKNTNVRRSKLLRVLRQLPSTWELKNVKRYWEQYDEGNQYITNVYHWNYINWYKDKKKCHDYCKNEGDDTALLLAQCEKNERFKS